MERCERVCFPIDRGQREVRSRGSNRKSFVLHELQGTTALTYSCGRYRLSLASSVRVSRSVGPHAPNCGFQDTNFITDPPDGAFP